MAQRPSSGLDRLTVKVSRSHTTRHTNGRTPLNTWSACPRGRYLHNTPQTQRRTSIPSAGFEQRAASNLRRRPHGQRDKYRIYLGIFFPTFVMVYSSCIYCTTILTLETVVLCGSQTLFAEGTVFLAARNCDILNFEVGSATEEYGTRAGAMQRMIILRILYFLQWRYVCN